MKVVSPRLLAFFLQQRKTTQVNLQKDVIFAQKYPNCKIGCGLIQNF